MYATALLFITLGAFAQTAPHAQPQAPMPPQAPAIKPPEAILPPAVNPLPSPTPKVAPQFLAYADARDEARKNVAPFVCFVGVTPRKIDGMLVASEDSLVRGAGMEYSAIFVSWDGRFGVWLSAQASDKEIRHALKIGQRSGPRLEAGQRALPFSQQPSAGELNSAVPLNNAEGSPFFSRVEQERIKKLWPKTLPFPAGLRFYRPTRYSQETTVTNEFFLFSPAHVSQGDNPNNRFPYVVPGGLHGIPQSEWNSYTGISVGTIKAFDELIYAPTAAQALREGYGRSGLLKKRTAELSHGSFVVDLLTNARDEVFELRILEFGEKFDAYAAYKDRSKAPSGYTGAGKRCVDCHGDAGSSKYGIGVRGIARNTFSVPLFKEGTVEWDTESFPLSFAGLVDSSDKYQPQTQDVFQVDDFGASVAPFAPVRRRGFRR